MVTLVTVSQVRARLNLPDDDGVNTAISATIKSVAPMVETQLQTSLTKQSAIDRFYPNDSVYPSVGGFFTLRLSNGFVRASPALVIKYDSGYSTVGDGVIIDPAECILKAEKGHLLIPDTYNRQYVQVQYDYGFLDSEKPPVWLQEASLIFAVEMLSSQKVGDPDPELTSIFKYWGDHRVSIMDAHLRSTAIAVPPL